MLKKIEQIEALLRELKKDYMTAQSLFSDHSTETKNIRGWMPCTVCDKKHRANHPHFTKK